MQIPKHVAIIMDGNGRWAQKRGRPRVFGHIKGSSRIKAIVKKADQLGIKALTLYAFSTENWSRPESELSVLWRLLNRYLLRQVPELDQQNVRLHIIGEPEKLSPELQKLLSHSVERLSKNTGMQLTLALSYGSRKEILQATQSFAKYCMSGKCDPKDLCEESLEKYLWTSKLGELSNVDLMIRTSGEQRVSNYLLWQSAYAEFSFLEISWPDFLPQHLHEAVDEYCQRERRFGGVEKK